MNNVEEILLSELVQARSYLDRLMHAITDLSNAFHRPEIRVCASNLTEELEQIIRSRFMNINYSKNSLIHREHLKTAKVNLKNLYTLVEAFLKLSPNKEFIIEDTAAIINCTYKYAKELHDLLKKFGNLEVQSPRIGFIKVKSLAPVIKPQKISEVKNYGRFSLLEGGLVDEEEDFDFEGEEFDELETAKDHSPKLYEFDTDKFINTINEENLSILGLESKREEKYDEYLSKGHKAAFGKKNNEALECFLKAKSFKDTAEINTLTAWIYTLTNEPEKAKTLLLRAISLDPDYGPPYNDLGSILLNENSLEEAIKWFELAKKASKYQNREYPYINAGRAYMMIQNYAKAIIEFEKAIEICPENEELISTVEKIKSSLIKENKGFRLHQEDGPEIN